MTAAGSAEPPPCPVTCEKRLEPGPKSRRCSLAFDERQQVGVDGVGLRSWACRAGSPCRFSASPFFSSFADSGPAVGVGHDLVVLAVHDQRPGR